MNERPIINVIYQDPRSATPPMGCLEALLSIVVIVVFLVGLVGLGGLL